jgi:4-carboxymuconolactone decarboxylase
VRDLHPALDSWMVVDGYGKVLSRPGLDLPRRELCIVAACAAMGQDRQLHSHLRGALNVGVEPAVLDEALAAIAGLVGAERTRSAQLLLARVLGK